MAGCTALQGARHLKRKDTSITLLKYPSTSCLDLLLVLTVPISIRRNSYQLLLLFDINHLKHLLFVQHFEQQDSFLLTLLWYWTNFVKINLRDPIHHCILLPLQKMHLTKLLLFFGPSNVKHLNFFPLQTQQLSVPGWKCLLKEALLRLLQGS